MSGKIFAEDPWNRLGDSALCTSPLLRIFLPSVNTPYSALIRGMLTVNPATRFTLRDAQQHSWVMKYVIDSLPLFVN